MKIVIPGECVARIESNKDGYGTNIHYSARIRCSIRRK